MLKNRFLLPGLALLAVLVLYYTFFANRSDNTGSGLNAAVDPASYRQTTETSRIKKNDFFRTSSDSPLTDKAAFKGLSYFAPDPTYRVVARLEPFADKTQKLVVRLSDGSDEVYDKVAHAVFRLNGETC